MAKKRLCGVVQCTALYSTEVYYSIVEHGIAYDRIVGNAVRM